MRRMRPGMRPPDLREGRDHHEPGEPEVLEKAVPAQLREAGILLDLIEQPVEDVGIMEREFGVQPARGKGLDMLGPSQC